MQDLKRWTKWQGTKMTREADCIMHNTDIRKYFQTNKTQRPDT